MTKDEIQTLNAKNDRIMKDIVQKVVDKRLRIKYVEDKYSLIRINDENKYNSSGKRYIVYFIEPAMLQTGGI